MLPLFGFFCHCARKSYSVAPVSNWDGPVTVDEMRTANSERDYSTTDLQSIANQIANDFHLEPNNVINYFARSKWASLSKNLFFRVDFNQVEKYQRAVYLGGTVVKITKSNGVYTVNCRQANVRGIAQPDFYRSFGMRRNSAVPNIRIAVRPTDRISGEDITRIYNTLYSKIEGQLNAYKAI
ncbi:hypothetical protein TVAG_422430 [Trichomonas vaginalis G3]|uniref:Uncharacterized protein n=1 Tax=Trichomonas vaginalis (strain ATCC PRA-98 / G3) TaxID=412133 RepID=A2FU68_TRIV3|nr:hypothetical protein TVAGG3_0737450 [Trichomonas vaginalis G3]EAX91548.1 hypothetical protein TVAG_422430 [Trichomonas vaginalis G3]KAI5511675.1 hypothetical protein TVAGG3_0737450 [Trichomonas vaginalis G3]|eukprot:XP_001304478.1 hypothetical protein [Trichomonas vaginalis G3]